MVASFPTMQPLKAHVRNGRLLLDEPTDLPDGDVVELVDINDVVAGGGDAAERAASDTELDRELEASLIEEESGQLIDIADVLADLRTIR